MKVKRLNPNDDKQSQRWEEFVLKNGYLWHSAKWINVVHKTYGFEPVYLYIEDKKNNIQSTLPMFFVKIPPFKNELVSLAHVEVSGIINTAYFHLYDDYLINRFSFKNLKIYQFEERIGNYPFDDSNDIFILDLPQDDKGIQKILKKGKRRKFNKIINEDIELNFGRSDENIEIFLRILKHRMREFGTPFHKDEYYYNFFQTFGDNAVLIMGKLNNTYIGATVGIVFKGTMYAMYQVYLPKYKNTKIGLTLEYALMSSALNRFKCKQYSLGRSQKETGSYFYKDSLKAKKYPMYIYNFKNKNGKLKPIKARFVKDRFHWATGIIKKTPMPILNLFSGNIRKWVY